MNGRLYGIGLGPGDPELLTLKALRLIRSADLIAYPAPQGGESFARSIVAEWLSAGQEELRMDIPMIADPNGAIPAYDIAAAQLTPHLQAGRQVAVLCQGDPFLYGSFSYLFARLSEIAAVEIVPGVSSMNAAAAELRQPLVSRDEVLSIVPATLNEAALETKLHGVDAAAILKLGRHLPKVKRVLDRLGLFDRARYIERATLPNQKTVRLIEVESENVPYFSMILVAGKGACR